jgi:TIGR03009 family protein
MARKPLRNPMSCFLMMFTVSSLAAAQVAQGPAGARNAPPAPVDVAQAPKAKVAVKAQRNLAAPKSANAGELERILLQWERQSASIKTLKTDFTREDDLVVANDKRKYEGQAAFQRPDLAYLNLQELGAAKILQPMTERFVCTTTEVWQFDNESKQIFISPLANGKGLNAVNRGPMPFLFNFKVDMVTQRYRFALIESTPCAPGKPGRFILEVTPLLPTDIQDFKSAMVLLNRERFLPDAIKLRDPNGRDTRLYRFSNTEANVDIDPSRFKPQPLRGFKVVQNPVAANQPADGRPAVGAAPKRDRRPAR